MQHARLEEEAPRRRRVCRMKRRARKSAVAARNRRRGRSWRLLRRRLCVAPFPQR